MQNANQVRQARQQQRTSGAPMSQEMASAWEAMVENAKADVLSLAGRSSAIASTWSCGVEWSMEREEALARLNARYR